MAARILSWKIDDYKYAYLVKVGGSHISNRITNETLLSEMVSEVGKWEFPTYKEAFLEMNEELKNAYNITIPSDGTRIDEYFGQVHTNDILVLTGKDGTKGSNGSNGLPGTGGDSSIYDDFNDSIDKKLDEIKDDIKKDNEDVKKEIEDKVTDTISDAKKEIEDTKKELDEVRKDLEEKLNNAKDALDKASKLFEMDDENITPDAIKEVFSATSEFSDWMTDYSGFVQDIKTDYDRASTKMGLIGTGESALDGLFTWFGTSLNTTSGTVGSVRQDLAAVSGVIAQYATWYDENAESAANAARIINASAATIEDTIKYIQGSGLTTEIERKMDAMAGTIIDKALAESELGVASVKNELNALSAYVVTQIVYENPDGTLTAIGDKMKAIEGEMERYMTRTDNLMKETTDLRESWSIASGKLSTVAQLTAETDADGNIIYYTSGSSGEQVVYYNPEDGKFYYDKEFTQECPASKVYVHFSSILDSYIKQTASSITISVSDNSALTASIKAEILGDKSFINMIADEVNIDAEVIMRELSAKTGNIGGIILHDGLIYSMKNNRDGNPEFILNGKTGGFSATNAYIRGDIVANSLTLGNSQTIEDYVKEKIDNAVSGSTGNTGTTGTTTGLTEDEVNKLIEDYLSSKEFNDLLASGGYITKDNIYDYVTSGSSGMTKDEIEALCERLVGTEVNKAMGIEDLGDGKYKHTVTVGGRTYEWITANYDSYILINNIVSGASGDTKYSFIVDKNGLLQANNAIIYGKIYASEGTFTGRIESKEGYIGDLVIKDGMISGNGFTIGEDGINGKGWDMNGSGVSISKGRIGAVNITDYGLEIYSGDTLTAFINGSADFANDKDRGRIIYSAGAIEKEDTKWYAWSTDNDVSDTLSEEGIIYTKVDFSLSSSTVNNNFYDGLIIDCYLYPGDAFPIEGCYASTYYYDEKTGKDVYVNRIYNFYSEDGTRIYYSRNKAKDVTLKPNNNNGSTRIYEDGTIATTKLEALGGLFVGDLDVRNGIFRGKINATAGTINNVNATNMNLSGNLKLYGKNSFTMYSGTSNTPYFIISNTEVSEGYSDFTIAVQSLSVYEKNYSDHNKVYSNSVNLASFDIIGGCIITIPGIYFTSTMYSPTGQKNPEAPYVRVYAELLNSGGTVVETKQLGALSDSSGWGTTHTKNNGRYRNYSGFTSGVTLTSSTDGKVKLTAFYTMKVKDRTAWDYAFGKITSTNMGDGMISVRYPELQKKMVFGSNGFNFNWGKNNAVSMIQSSDGNVDITLQRKSNGYGSTNANSYGIKITSQGISINLGQGYKQLTTNSDGTLKLS